MDPALSLTSIDGFLHERALKLPETAPLGAFLWASAHRTTAAINIHDPLLTGLIHEATKTHHFFLLYMQHGRISSMLNDLPLGGRKIDFLIIVAHGNKKGFKLADTEDGFIDSERIKDLDLTALNPKANICCLSCEAGHLVIPALQDKLPKASIWGSMHKYTHPFLLPTEHPKKPRIMLVCHDGAGRMEFNPDDMIYPTKAPKPSIPSEWVAEAATNPSYKAWIQQDVFPGNVTHTGDIIGPFKTLGERAITGDKAALERIYALLEDSPYLYYMLAKISFAKGKLSKGYTYLINAARENYGPAVTLLENATDREAAEIQALYIRETKAPEEAEKRLLLAWETTKHEPFLFALVELFERLHNKEKYAYWANFWMQTYQSHLRT